MGTIISVPLIMFGENQLFLAIKKWQFSIHGRCSLHAIDMLSTLLGVIGSDSWILVSGWIQYKKAKPIESTHRLESVLDSKHKVPARFKPHCFEGRHFEKYLH